MENIPLSQIVEIMTYCVIHGVVDKKSNFECRLYEDLLEQLTNMKVGFQT